MKLGSSERKRIVVVAIAIFCFFSLLIIQFFRIQIVEGERWTRVAQSQHFLILTEPFVRGTFYSNTSIKKGHPEKPQPFVVDIQKYHLYIDPQGIPDEYRNEVAKNIILLAGVPAAEQMEVRAQLDFKSRSRKLVMWLDLAKRDAVQRWWLSYARSKKLAPNVLFFVPDYQRSYPFGKMLGQVLHTIQSNKDEVTKQGLPTGGLELQFNEYLKGKQGKRRIIRSPRNSFETGEVIESPQNGADVYLTVNHYLQAITEEEIEKGVKASNAKAGWAVMMDPFTGEILAMAQYPFFYPALYKDYFNDPQKAGAALCKMVSDANEPGSTFKPFTLATALQANAELRIQGKKEVFTPEEKIATSSGVLPGRKPMTDTHSYAFLNMDMGLQKSSNIYMSRLIDRVVTAMGKEWYRSVLSDVFGFGSKTGIELPAESAGVLPKIGKMHANGTLEWSSPTHYSLAIGHNLQVTTIQMLRAYSIFANGGYLVKPTLVRKIVKTLPDGTEQVLVDNTGEERRKAFPRVLDLEVIQRTVRSLRFATKPGGTATRADINGFTELGKTGSARKIVDGQYSTQKHFSTFIGYAPVEHAAFVLLVAMDEPEVKFIPGVGPNAHGGLCAAPVFREIAKRTLQYLGREPDDPHGYPVGDPRRDLEKADWMKEVRELSELYKQWNH